jgi:hypothetical protein
MLENITVLLVSRVTMEKYLMDRLGLDTLSNVILILFVILLV